MTSESSNLRTVEEREALPLSLLNDYLYCPRRAALKLVEGWRNANVHTERGDIVHEHADLAGYEVVRGTTLLRALPVWSERLGLSGKCDIVEHRPGGFYFPVEFKLGRRRQWSNDDVQLCAQALCLEEMFSTSVPAGAIFHADSKRRREVVLGPELRAVTQRAVMDLRQLLESKGGIPAAVYRPACDECSLYETCLPRVVASSDRVRRQARQLFDP